MVPNVRRGIHGEMNKNDCFNNLIKMIVKICEIAQLTRATPGSSLVFNMRNLLSIAIKGRNSFPMNRTFYTLMQNLLSGFMAPKMD